MAEIKSTMDLVMERMAKMTADSPPVTDNEDQIRSGMRLAADYLNNLLTDLVEELAKQPPEQQQAMHKGAVTTLLRNVVLPRDEDLRERSDQALRGILAIANKIGVTSISQTCDELQQILQQYNQHKVQVTQQLDDALLGQLKQQYMSQGTQPPENLTATMHPKYAEELTNMVQDLNNQYNQAMDQRKESMLQQLKLG